MLAVDNIPALKFDMPLPQAFTTKNGNNQAAAAPITTGNVVSVFLIFGTIMLPATPNIR
jgi:hypothetical protein